MQVPNRFGGHEDEAAVGHGFEFFPVRKLHPASVLVEKQIIVVVVGIDVAKRRVVRNGKTDVCDQNIGVLAAFLKLLSGQEGGRT